MKEKSSYNRPGRRPSVNKLEQISFSIDNNLYDRLKAFASIRSLSVSSAVRMILAERLTEGERA